MLTHFLAFFGLQKKLDHLIHECDLCNNIYNNTNVINIIIITNNKVEYLRSSTLGIPFRRYSFRR